MFKSFSLLLAVTAAALVSVATAVPNTPGLEARQSGYCGSTMVCCPSNKFSADCDTDADAEGCAKKGRYAMCCSEGNCEEISPAADV